MSNIETLENENGQTLKNFAMCKNLKEVEQELNESLCNSGFDNRRVLWALVTFDLELRKFKIYDWRDSTYKYNFFKTGLPANEIIMLNRFEINNIVKEMIELAPNLEQKLRQLHIKAQMNDYDIGRLLGQILEKTDYKYQYEGWEISEVETDLKKRFGATKDQTAQYIKYLSHERILGHEWRETKLKRYEELN